MDFLDFLHEYCEEKSETFTEFYINFVLSRNIKKYSLISSICEEPVENNVR